jgi:hypothetical protein
MCKKYIFRAGIEWNTEYFDDVNRPKVPACFPMELGPFHLAMSPNSTYYGAQMGWLQEHAYSSIDGPPPDQNYPNSLIFAETPINVESDSGNEEALADVIFEQLEAMFRIFLPGDLYVRRSLSIGMNLKEDSLVWGAYVFSRPIKPKPEILYDRIPYLLNDETMLKFKKFFDQYWVIIHEKRQPIYNASFRFNSSYERRTLSDRVIELMIAMEALFGDNEYQRYKIPLRSACLLYSPGQNRKSAFKKVRDLYDQRSSIVHTGKLDIESENNEIVDWFEDYTRKAIVKFLELHNGGSPITSGPQLDDLLFLNRDN